MANLKYQKGDLFKFVEKDKTPIKIIPHVCNDIGGWGSGFVVALSKWNKKPEKCYRDWHKLKYLDDCGDFQLGNMNLVIAKGQMRDDYVDDYDLESGVIVANMIAQHNIVTNYKNGGIPLRYWALVSCMEKVSDFLVSRKYWPLCDVKIHAPKFGSALAGGKWDIIEILINEIWVDRGIEVVVYEY